MVRDWALAVDTYLPENRDELDSDKASEKRGYKVTNKMRFCTMGWSH